MYFRCISANSSVSFFKPLSYLISVFNGRNWPKLVPVLKLSCHESQFEAINIFQFNVKNVDSCNQSNVTSPLTGADCLIGKK